MSSAFASVFFRRRERERDRLQRCCHYGDGDERAKCWMSWQVDSRCVSTLEGGCRMSKREQMYSRWRYDSHRSLRESHTWPRSSGAFLCARPRLRMSTDEDDASIICEAISYTPSLLAHASHFVFEVSRRELCQFLITNLFISVSIRTLTTTPTF